MPARKKSAPVDDHVVIDDTAGMPPFEFSLTSEPEVVFSLPAMTDLPLDDMLQIAEFESSLDEGAPDMKALSLFVDLVRRNVSPHMPSLRPRSLGALYEQWSAHDGKAAEGEGGGSGSSSEPISEPSSTPVSTQE